MSEPDLVPRTTTLEIYAADARELRRLKKEGQSWPDFFHEVAGIILEELGPRPPLTSPDERKEP